MHALRSILLATDFRASSEAASDAAIRLATTFQAEVTVLHVREEFLTWPVTPFENQDRLTQHLAQRNVNVKEFQVHAGPAADLIVRKTQELEPDLLLIGTGEKVSHGQLVIGPIAQAVLENVPSPVLAVHPHGPKLSFRTIVCPVDQSRLSRRALEDALVMARVFGAKLVVVSVIPEINWLMAAVETGALAGAKLEHESKWSTEFEQLLSNVSFDGVDWKRDLRHGVPQDQILAAVAEHGADLLVMGATGRTGLARVLLGSVTRRILRHLPCSILLVKDRTVFEEQFILDLEAMERLVNEGHDRLRAGMAAEAAGKFRQVLALDPYHRVALEGLTIACEQLGDTQAAARYRQRIARLPQ